MNASPGPESQATDLDQLVLREDGLVLRPLHEADVPVITRAMQDRRMHRFLPLPDPFAAADARRWVDQTARERHSGVRTEFGVEVDGQLCGAAGLKLPVARGAVGWEIGYSVYPWAQGRGLAARVTRVLFDRAVAQGAARVFIRCAVGNVASAMTALNAGFAFEGVARRNVLTPRGPEDAAVFGRLPTDAGHPVAPRCARLPDGGLCDGVVTLRAMGPLDAPAYLDEITDAEAVRWSFDGRVPRLADALAGLERAGLDWLTGPNARMAITDTASGEVTGSMLLRQVGPPGTAVIGYGMRPSWRGRGYTARALRLLRGWALDPAGGGLARLELGAKAGNIASQKVAERGGFVLEGRLRGRLRTADGGMDDEVMFSAVRPSGP